jgi:beta-galactosidase
MLKLAGTAAAAWCVDSIATAAVPLREEGLQPDLRNQRFGSNWRFHRGDGPGYALPSLDDAAWRTVSLPHDWSIEDLPGSDPTLNAIIREADLAPIWQKVAKTPLLIGPFDARLNDNKAPRHSANGGPNAFTVGGIGWYRKRFKLPPLAPDAKVELAFDGVYMNSQVWLNGSLIAEHPYGYSAFAVDLTPHLNRDGSNLLAVKVANLGRNSRWYSGSGIYRHVWLDIVRQAGFDRWGLTVTTPSVDVSAATVQVVARTVGSPSDATLTTRIRDAAGRVVGETTSLVTAPTSLTITRPRLWSPESPNLYTVECELRTGDRLFDRMTSPLGIRTVQMDATTGLRINGKPYKLRGGCVHHDNGLLGAAAIERAEIRKVELLKARGFNALRASHNPSSPEFLAACDRLGMLVIEESFDVWRVGKNPDDYNLYFDGWWQEDLTAMVRRGSNHPSVIIWSIGNEIPERGDTDGVETAKMLADEIRRLDPTRPVTQAISGFMMPPQTRTVDEIFEFAAQHVDVVGYNYQLKRYAPDHLRFPDRVMVGTESWPREVDAVWRQVDSSPQIIGDFVWAAMDYLGEASIGRTGLDGDAATEQGYPWFAAWCGDLDLIGQQRPQSLARDVVWGLSELEIAVQRPLPDGKKETPYDWGWRDELPSWSWPGAEGKSLSISVYTRADRVTIELNGRNVIDQTLEPSETFITQFPLVYEPGRLVVTAWRAGRRIGRRTLETAGIPAALRLSADRPRIGTSRDDLAYVTASVLDAAGRPVPDAVHVVEIETVGPVELAAFGNANPRGVASFRQPVAKTWHGQALAILRPTGGAGTASLIMRSEGLASATTRILVA